MPIRLLSTNGHRDDISPHNAVDWHGVVVKLSPARLTGIVVDRSSRKVHGLCLFSLYYSVTVRADDIPVLFSCCITVTSLTYLTQFHWASREKHSFIL